MRSGSGPPGPSQLRSSMWPSAGGGAAKPSSVRSASRRSATDSDSALGGFTAASRSRNLLAWGSRGTVGSDARPDRCAVLEREGLTHGRRPARRLDTVHAEQRHGQTVDAESDTTGVRHLPGCIADAPHGAEVLAVVVEAH